MSTELDQAERFIFDRLTADAQLDALVGSDGVHNTIAPEGTSPPYVLYHQAVSHDVRGIGTDTIQNELRMVVKGVTDEPTYATVELIAQRIQACLHGQRDPSGPVLACVRDAIVSYGTDEGNEHERYRGGEYKIIVASTS